MPNYLDSILELAKQATPLPWEKDICAIDPEMGGDSLAVTTSDHDASYIVAACNAVPKLIARVRELERQRDWLVNYYAKAEAPLPCPYLEGSFDQTKPCPFWVSDSGEMPEDDTVGEWRKLLLAPVEYGDEYLDCGTSLNVCLRFAAEKAAKEAGE